MIKSAALRSLSIFFILIPILLGSSSKLTAQLTGPNVILIMADDLGFECIGANGGTSYETPGIDRLALSGMRFENCHSQPLCTPSRVQIMTGIYNVRNYTDFGVLDRGQITFGNLFKEAGYATVIAGKWQLGKEEDAPHHFGFNEYCLWQHRYGRVDDQTHDTRFSNPRLEVNGQTIRYTGGEYGPDLVSDFICDFIEKNKDKPFLAYYPMILTHCPFTPTPDSKDWDPQDMGSLSYKGEPIYFSDMVAYMDKMVGKIVAKLDELGLRENTLIVFTGDNGTDQPIVSMLAGKEYVGGKGLTSDNGTHVPLVASWPGTIKGASICHDLVDFSDILHTLCEAAGIRPPGELMVDGRSILPQLKGQVGQPREWIYGWYARDGKTNAKEWVRDKNYKLYRSGELYNVTVDLYEQNPLDIENLERVLEIYKDKRPN
jgi:arylsulfatase A